MRLWVPAPKKDSHKGQNGVVLMIGGSKTYHGAPILAALAAMRFCDLVYFYSVPQNVEVIKKMKIATPNVICIGKKELKEVFCRADCILIGNGMDVSAETARMVRKVLKSKKKCVLDAAALRVLPPFLLHSNTILTPHTKEFEAAFGKPASAQAVAEISRRCGCTILLKGRTDFVASFGKINKIKGGNAGMTKGGTGDVLAGLVAAIFSTCPSPKDAAITASYLNKKAAEHLHKVLGCFFSSTDLALELGFVAAMMHECGKPIKRIKNKQREGCARGE
ncbi:MAG: NAD(P)H-hydrate dehydratase [Candidatus Anstonellaceae archaeon]